MAAFPRKSSACTSLAVRPKGARTRGVKIASRKPAFFFPVSARFVALVDDEAWQPVCERVSNLKVRRMLLVALSGLAGASCTREPVSVARGAVGSANTSNVVSPSADTFLDPPVERVALASASAERPEAASATGGPLLPSLPPPSNTSSSSLGSLRLRVPSPSSPCSPGMGWDGLECVALSCAKGMAFKNGSGCLVCIGDCPDFPEWAERHPWSASLDPFDATGARQSVSNVDLSDCRAGVDPPGFSHALVAFVPTGAVGHVAIDGPRFAGTAAGQCVVEKLMGVRVKPFGGGVVFVGQSFTLR